ncbi:type I secretion system permease/ATPase [Paremcibacter congregatus]|uniref:Type I secretion system permease/ATPase n=1 Tax=Paremcibacter congregatus TaxID=2043170 RepID=A0A2G4YVD9_9PROT|nr:type I secretion system permease/ATPase [Paremcibacter congregatus]PHZ86277.1 type I secretion system permease/ATPase [Paremcibacter congregatus]QDE27244.1 type I secretion system permease/ATPase [Paremcibacter congregatus]
MSDAQDTTLGATTTPGKIWQDHWFWGAFRQNWWTYGQIILAAVMINFFSLGSSVFIMTVYDRVIPNNAVDSLVALCVGMFIIIGFDFLLKYLRAYFIDTAGQNVDMTVANGIFDRIMKLKLSTQKGSTGGLVNTVREFESIRDFCTSATLATVVDVPFIFLFLLVIAIIGGPIVIVPALAVPFVLIVGFAIQPFLSRFSKEGMQEGGSKQSTLVEMVSGLETLKTLGSDQLFQDRWSKAVESHSKVSLRSRLFSQIAINSAASAQQLTQVGIVAYGFVLIMQGELSIGGLIACVIIAGRCLAPLGQLANLLTRYNHAKTAYAALDKLMKQDSEETSDRDFIRRESLKGKIEFKNVTFKYPDQPMRALDSVSFTVEPGEKIGVLGKIGSGKSTVLRLAAGLYEPDEGAVLIDDTDLRQIVPEDLRRNMAVVLQDIVLFSGSIKENITMGHDDVADADILRAAEISGAQDFLGKIPNGYDVKLRDRGEGLSGGQKQALAIARALVRKAPLVMMDEPTSAMDTSSEMKLISQLKEELKDRTFLIVTHRPSMLALVDKIIVIDQGKVVAQGPKDDVLKFLGGGQNATIPGAARKG